MDKENSIIRDRGKALLKIGFGVIIIPCVNFLILVAVGYLTMNKLGLALAITLAMISIFFMDYILIKAFEEKYNHSYHYIELATAFVQCLLTVFTLLCFLNFFPKNDGILLPSFSQTQNILAFLGVAIFTPFRVLIPIILKEKKED